MALGKNPKVVLLGQQPTVVYGMAYLAECSGKSVGTLIGWIKRGVVKPDLVDNAGRNWFSQATLDAVREACKNDAQVGEVAVALGVKLES